MLGSLLVEGDVAELALAAQLVDRYADFGLPTQSNELFLGESALLNAHHFPG